MKRIGMSIAAAGLTLLAFGSRAQAQSITLSPAIGAHIPASDFEELRAGGETLRVERDGTLALGLNVEMGWLRGSVAYASGAKLTEDGVSGSGQIGEGSVLTAAADVVLRPLPRLVIVQPYLLGGIGLKNTSYDFDEAGIRDAFPDDRTDTALHFGVGADLMLGGIGVMAEVTDYLSKDADGDWGSHDAFAMVGVKLRLGF